jgi:hypothetical protein
MLSHSMNSTARDEELGYNNPYNPFASPGGSSFDNGLNVNNNNNPYSSGYRGKRDVLSEDGTDSDSQEKQPLNLSNEEDHADPAVSQTPLKTAENEDSPEEPIVPPSSGTNDDDVKPPASVVRGRSFPRDGDEETSGGSKSARQISTNDPTKTRRPIETGVVYTKWGSISAGRLIAGKSLIKFIS